MLNFLRSNWRKLSTGVLAALMLSAGGIELYKLTAGDCCAQGSSCCYPGSPCCHRGK